MSINKCFLVGRLTRDAELKTTRSGMAILTFGIAVNDRRKNQQTGEWEDYPNFLDCVMAGNRANAIAQIVTKGMLVSIEGKLHYSSWEKDGQRRSKIEIYVDEIEFLSQGQRQQAPQQQYQQPMQQYQQAPRQQAPQQQYYPNQAPMGYQQHSMPDVYDEDIPFGG